MIVAWRVKGVLPSNREQDVRDMHAANARLQPPWLHDRTHCPRSTGLLYFRDEALAEAEVQYDAG